MSADEPRLGYALWDLVMAITVAALLLAPLLVVAGVGVLLWQRGRG